MNVIAVDFPSQNRHEYFFTFQGNEIKIIRDKSDTNRWDISVSSNGIKLFSQATTLDAAKEVGRQLSLQINSLKEVQ